MPGNIQREWLRYRRVAWWYQVPGDESQHYRYSLWTDFVHCHTNIGLRQRRFTACQFPDELSSDVAEQYMTNHQPGGKKWVQRGTKIMEQEGGR